MIQHSYTVPYLYCTVSVSIIPGIINRYGIIVLFRLTLSIKFLLRKGYLAIELLEPCSKTARASQNKSS